ncbi:MAG: DUF2591 family protein [Pseudomonadota bacterium]|nr:DUF2591 family protein [Pseudomonadota bacterium]
MEVRQLCGAWLDGWVARTEDLEIAHLSEAGCYVHTPWRKSHPDHYQPLRYQPSRNWSQGGPLLEMLMHMGMEIDMNPGEAGRVTCILGSLCISGENLLQAAMRCYVAVNLGPDVPDEILKPC